MVTASLVASFVIILDFITKFLVKAYMELGESFSVIPGLFNITYVLNKGAAWGMLSDKRWIFLSFSVIALIIVGFFIFKFRNGSKVLTVSLSLIFGGGFGNMIDRTFNGDVIFDGAVVDFIETAFMDFPVFNVADCAVVIGAALMLFYIIFVDGKGLEKSSHTAKQNTNGISDCDKNIEGTEQ